MLRKQLYKLQSRVKVRDTAYPYPKDSLNPLFAASKTVIPEEDSLIKHLCSVSTLVTKELLNNRSAKLALRSCANYIHYCSINLNAKLTLINGDFCPSHTAVFDVF